MKKVRIDFAPPGVVRTMLRAPRGAWALVLAALASSMSAAMVWATYRQDQREVERFVARVETVSRPAPPVPVLARPPVPEAQATAVNAAVLQLNLPWRALHDAVQAATPASIALLALEPDARKHAVRITAEAKSSDDMVAYVDALQKVEWFDTVALSRHEINEQDPNRPIRFQIDAQWRAAR